MTVHVTENSVDEITMGSDWKGLGTTQAVTSVSNKKPGRNRINSISKLLKTPLVSTVEFFVNYLSLHRIWIASCAPLSGVSFQIG